MDSCQNHCATSIDYSPKTKDTKKFFAMVRNKLHFAITGQTAAEIVAKRADSNKPNMEPAYVIDGAHLNNS